MEMADWIVHPSDRRLRMVSNRKSMYVHKKREFVCIEPFFKFPPYLLFVSRQYYYFFHDVFRY